MIRKQAKLTGIVQGVGFRPFVVRQALRWGLTGWVKNGAEGVTLEVQGRSDAVCKFLDELSQHAPRAARITGMQTRPRPCRRREHGFRVIASSEGQQPRPSVPADLALCPECRREIATPGERRHGYPFTNCTQCGPRATLVESLPYDRQRTTMRAFALCEACRDEYEDVSDRRFHAEPIACPSCGPQLSLLDQSGKLLAERGAALSTAAALLGAGKIVALRGLGGFQLLVDATNDAAVGRLRERKAREAKPFAVLFRDSGQLQQHAHVSAGELALLGGPEAPVVLLSARANTGLAASLAPGTDEVGALLPYTPLHELLMQSLSMPLVCTSGNLSDEPMSLTTEHALEALGGVADVWLTHDRPIARVMDDSVARLGPRGPELIRRARGYAPSTVAELRGAPSTLALGAHYKNTLALLHAGELVVSQHLGDLDSHAARLAQRQALDDLLRFFRAEPALLACDMHPDYASTRLAEELAERWGLPLRRVQHHQAHIAAVVAEHGLSGPLCGLAWDGAGLGSDGTLWGSEAFRWDAEALCHAGHLESFPLPGGERAQREPRRVALGLCHQLGVQPPAGVSAWFSAAERQLLDAVLENDVNCPRTNSVGRLFDAVAALLGLRGRSSYEGQAALELEALAHRAPPDVGAYSLPLAVGATPLEPLYCELMADLARGVEHPLIARRFHGALVGWGLALAQREGVPDVVFTGGCFQNRLLSRELEQALREAGFRAWRPRALPPNDGQIAAGQAWLAALAARGTG